MLNSKPDAQSLFGSAPSRFYVITFCTPVDVVARPSWTIHPTERARDSSNRYLVALLRYVIRSLRSLAFFMPAKAILVPGMYFFGFSR